MALRRSMRRGRVQWRIQRGEGWGDISTWPPPPPVYRFAKPERRTLKFKISQICLLKRQESYAMKFCLIFTSKCTKMRLVARFRQDQLGGGLTVLPQDCKGKWERGHRGGRREREEREGKGDDTIPPPGSAAGRVGTVTYMYAMQWWFKTYAIYDPSVQIDLMLWAACMLVGGSDKWENRTITIVFSQYTALSDRLASHTATERC